MNCLFHSIFFQEAIIILEMYIVMVSLLNIDYPTVRVVLYLNLKISVKYYSSDGNIEIKVYMLNMP